MHFIYLFFALIFYLFLIIDYVEDGAATHYLNCGVEKHEDVNGKQDRKIALGREVRRYIKLKLTSTLIRLELLYQIR